MNTSYTNASVSSGKIKINSSATQHIVFPSGDTIGGAIYAGIIKFTTETIQDEVLGPGDVAVGPGSWYITDEDVMWIKIPSSDEIKGFKITDIGFEDPSEEEAKIEFKITDNNDGDTWEVEKINFNEGTPITIEKIRIKSKSETYNEDELNLLYNPDVGIDLLHLTTQYLDLPEPDKYNAANYPNAGIGSLNTLEIEKLDEIFYVKFDIY